MSLFDCSIVPDSVSVDILEKCSLFILRVHVYRLVVTDP